MSVETKVQSALAKIEQAQNLLSAACADLSAICGAVPHWKRTGKLSDACHAEWRKLAYTDKRKWKLDGHHASTGPTPAEIAHEESMIDQEPID